MEGSSSTERRRRVKLAAEAGHVQPSGARNNGRAIGRRHQNNKAECNSPKEEELAAAFKDGGVGGDEDNDDEEEVEARMRALQRLVPGGQEMPVDVLLEETAEYIEALREQVSIMRALASYQDGLEKEKRMTGR